tara:strand:+ start:2112 stop:2621 length:510 start_codon:yes stop_codon:yes gene_type:complete
MVLKDSDLNVIDDYLDDVNFKKVSGVMLSTNFPWFYNDNIVSKDDEGYFQFVHSIYSDCLPRSDYFNLLEPILNKIEPKGLVRIKANLTTRTEQHITHKQHTDLPFILPNSYTSVLYLNSNNGGTVFGKGNVVNSLSNRLVTFPMHKKHSGKTCTDEKRRVVINFNYFK